MATPELSSKPPDKASALCAADWVLRRCSSQLCPYMSMGCDPLTASMLQRLHDQCVVMLAQDSFYRDLTEHERQNLDSKE